MNRTTARVTALLMLLLYGGAFGAASVLDGAVAARASDATAHIEGKAGASCSAHDEATCELCRAATLTGCSVLRVAATAVRSPDRIEAPAAQEVNGARLFDALHSRAPPAA